MAVVACGGGCGISRRGDRGPGDLGIGTRKKFRSGRYSAFYVVLYIQVAFSFPLSRCRATQSCFQSIQKTAPRARRVGDPGRYNRTSASAYSVKILAFIQSHVLNSPLVITDGYTLSGMLIVAREKKVGPQRGLANASCRRL
jgi:hypothetical protein